MECEPAPWLIPWRSARLAGLVTDPALDALPLDAHRRAAHLRFSSVETILHALFDEELHSAQVDSLANAAGGVLVAGSLALRAIGRGYALLSEGQSKHGGKQVDRLVGNAKIDLQEKVFPAWVRFVVGPRPKVIVVLDWTDFDKDGHSTLSLCLLTRHGRATPLLWKTVSKTELKDQRTAHERSLLTLLHGLLDDKVEVTLLADRGFGDQDLYVFLMALGWDFVIRFRGNVTVGIGGESRPAKDWVQGGRARLFKQVRVTTDETEIPAAVFVQAKGMKEPWCLATSLDQATASEVVKLYGRRFSIEETFRDQKDIHFGLGLSATHVKSPDRRDRLLLLGALAQALLTLLGAAGEKIGWDRTFRTGKSTKRPLSLFKQGQFWFSALGMWSSERVKPLQEAYDQVLRDHAISLEILGEI
jgi:hypothetical protein